MKELTRSQAQEIWDDSYDYIEAIQKAHRLGQQEAQPSAPDRAMIASQQMAALLGAYSRNELTTQLVFESAQIACTATGALITELNRTAGKGGEG